MTQRPHLQNIEEVPSTYIRRSSDSAMTSLFSRVATSFLILLAVALAALAADVTLPPLPPTPKKPQIDVYHGVKVEDDYQWLENWNDPAVRNWSDAENRHARAYLAALPGRHEIRDRLKALITHVPASYYGFQYTPSILLAFKFDTAKQQPVLVTLDSPDKPQSERVVVDPNKLDSKGTTTIDFCVPSLDGSRVAVSLSEGGSENGTLHIYDVRSGKALADVIPRVNKGTGGGSVAWNADGAGLYYTRYPSPGERPQQDLDFYQQVYFHKLGTPLSEDAYSLGKDLPRIAEIQLQTSPDGRYVLATVANGDGGEFQHFLRGADGDWRQLTQFSDGATRAVFGRDEALYMVCLKESPHGRILRLLLDRPELSSARTIVPQADDVIESVALSDTRLYVSGVWGGPSDIRVFDLEGHARGKIPLEPVSSVFGLLALKGDVLLYENESYIQPQAWYRFDASTGKSTRTALFVKPSVDFSDTEVVREFAASKDGTKVPMSIIRRKGTRLDGRNPALLTAYGGFGISLTPSYDLTARIWLDQGGVMAIGNLRGGSEFGEEWHKGGMLTHKQNVFDDFAACAQYLIKAGYTNPSKLAIQGASNGGLLMGAELTQHPNLFRAVVSGVGIYDMLRNELSPNAVFNVTEYGSVKDSEQFKALYAYSPYHHVVKGTAYPAVLFMTGANDPRVNPMNSRKMAAALQAATASGLPVLLRTSADTGHIGSSLEEEIEEDADTFAFVFKQLGMTMRAQ
jgi:prolyl oligopeptidase